MQQIMKILVLLSLFTQLVNCDDISELQADIKALTGHIVNMETKFDQKQTDDEKQLLELREEILELRAEIFGLKNGIKADHPTAAFNYNKAVYLGFTAYIDASLDIFQDEKVIFDQALTNAGGHYSTASGEFLVPVDGLYYFSATSLAAYGQEGVIFIMKNDEVLATVESDLVESYRNQATNAVVIECVAGDIMWLKAYGDGQLYSADRHNTFSGILLALVSP